MARQLIVACFLKEYAVINWFSFHGLQDKKYYPTAEEVYGPEVEVRIILSPAI